MHEIINRAFKINELNIGAITFHFHPFVTAHWDLRTFLRVCSVEQWKVTGEGEGRELLVLTFLVLLQNLCMFNKNEQKKLFSISKLHRLVFGGRGRAN